MLEIQTKALDAYLRARHKSLASTLSILGQDPTVFEGVIIGADPVGRIARFLGMTPEDLVAACARHQTATEPPIEITPVVMPTVDEA